MSNFIKLTFVGLIISFIGSVVVVMSEKKAEMDDVYTFMNDFGGGSGRPTGDDVDNETLAFIAEHMPQSAIDALNQHCQELIENRLELDAKEEADATTEGGVESRRRMSLYMKEKKRRLTVDSVCVGDESVFCEAATAAYSTGGAYEDIAVILQSLGGASLLPTGVPSSQAIESYTNADVYAIGAVAVRAAALLIDSVGEWCDAAANCADAIPIIGGLISCIADLACTTVSIIANAVLAAANFYLDYGDFHDGVLLTTQMQAVFEDREHIIANQKYLGNTFETLINALEEHIDEQFEILTEFVDERVSDLENLINERFSDLTELNIELFNTQNAFLNTKLNDISILLRTPSGQRPGWNDQDTSDIVEDPTTIDVPVATFNGSDFS